MSAIAGRIALVTGGNKGIGFAICRALSRHPSIALTLLASRDSARGSTAAAALLAEGCTNIKPITLDIDSPSSLSSAVQHVRSTYGRFDLLVNNAAIAVDRSSVDAQIAEQQLRTNYYSTMHCTAAFLPLLAHNGRVVNVSSKLGRKALQAMSSELRERFVHATELRQIDALAEEYVAAVRDGQLTERGWPTCAFYDMSKALLSMATRIQGAQSVLQSKQIAVNACCPGWCKTALAQPGAVRTAEQGAEVVVWLATLPDEERSSGKFAEELPGFVPWI